jgi:large repetitive protein
MSKLTLNFLLLVCASVALRADAFAQAPPTQASFDVQMFQPSPHGESFFSVESGAVSRSLDVRASLFLNYAYRPLQLAAPGGARIGGVIDHRFDANLLGAVSLFHRLSIGLGVPVALYQGATLSGVGGAAASLSPVNFGDLRLSPKVGILDQRRFQIDVALLFNLTLPTGNEGAFAGDRTVTVSPEIDIGRRFGPVRAALNFNYLWRERSQLLTLVVGPELGLRFGLGFDITYFVKNVPVEIIGEIYGKTSAVTPFASIDQTPLEWLLGAKWAIIKRVLLSAGVGRGFTRGYGSPAVRAFVGVTFIPIMYEPPPPEVPPRDTDKDGIIDEDDKCKTEPEDKDGFKDDDGCPDPDNDRDGIPDTRDLCPNDDIEDKDGFEDEDGCFDPDNDKDGIPDAVDKCRNVPEDKDGFQDEDGCPEGDNDGDGIIDAKDKCPNEPEIVNEFEDFDGCPDKGPSFVVVKKESIDILQKVYFETGSAKILEKSFGLLNQVANTMKNHGEMKLVKIEGHTDDVGDDAFNLKLSQKRADSVRDYLIAQGVEAGRLKAIGYGETKPVAPNSTPRGRETNRRVAFSIDADD